MKKLATLTVTHLVALVIGFAAGIYALPILTAPKGPSIQEAKAQAQDATYKGAFKRNLTDSDALHWGEGEVFVSQKNITLAGEVSPGPAYKLYLSPEFVETEADFMRLKPQMTVVGDVKTFKNFIIPVPGSVDVSKYKAVIIWCESFSQFITAAAYQ